jgi:hypothetical protein
MKLAMGTSTRSKARWRGTTYPLPPAYEIRQGQVDGSSFFVSDVSWTGMKCPNYGLAVGDWNSKWTHGSEQPRPYTFPPTPSGHLRRASTQVVSSSKPSSSVLRSTFTPSSASRSTSLTVAFIVQELILHSVADFASFRDILPRH